MDTFIVALKAVLPLFLVVFTGFLFSRTRTASVQWIDILNRYALLIGFPALVIASLMNLDPVGKSWTGLILINSLYIIICMLLAFPVSRAFGLSLPVKRSLFLILSFGNVSYLGIPVLQNAYGNDILPEAAILSAVYVFWLLTLGILLIETTGGETFHGRKLIFSLLKNPLLLSVFAGSAIVIFRVELPVVVQKTIQLFSGSVTAVVLFSLGLFLGLHNAGKKQDWLKAGVWVIITMMVIPLIYSFVIRRTNLPVAQVRASIIDAAMPLGLTPYALAVQYQLDTPLVARIVVLGTFLSVFLIPLWISFVG